MFSLLIHRKQAAALCFLSCPPPYGCEQKWRALSSLCSHSHSRLCFTEETAAPVHAGGSQTNSSWKKKKWTKACWEFLTPKPSPESPGNSLLFLLGGQNSCTSSLFTGRLNSNLFRLINKSCIWCDISSLYLMYYNVWQMRELCNMFVHY